MDRMKNSEVRRSRYQITRPHKFVRVMQPFIFHLGLPKISPEISECGNSFLFFILSILISCYFSLFHK